MNVSVVLAAAAAISIAAALAWWPWRGAPASPLSHAGRALRFVAILALLLLALDPGIRAALSRERPLVLLDNSVSMHATGGMADSARALATSLGDVMPFGEMAPGHPGAGSRLGDAMAAATSSGRPIVVVSDGEISDAARLPTDLLAQASIVVLPRPVAPDVAITDVRMPTRLGAGDTLMAEITVRATPPVPDSVRVEVRDSGRVLAGGAARFNEGGVASLVLRAPWPDGITGERRLEVVRVGDADAEPLDDVRIRRITVSATPGVVVLASLADFDARFLYSTLQQVLESPVRGYAQLAPDQWRRMDDLRPVSGAEVTRAARGADLLAVRGDTTPWRSAGRARLFWPEGGVEGDWYATPSTSPSPLLGAFVGIESDSLPSLPAAGTVTGAEWIALTARQARRGTDHPIVAGREEGGRTVLIAASGLYHWAFRGGQAEQAWRAVLGQAAAWLLASPPTPGATVRALDPVTERGRAVRFQATTATQPLPITARREDQSVSDTLRFDAEGVAHLPLPPGEWRWEAGDGSAGIVEVEQYAAELVPSAPTLESREAEVAPVPARRSLREVLPFFAFALAAFLAEWVIRRRLGMR